MNNKKGEGCVLSWQLLEFHLFPFFSTYVVKYIYMKYYCLLSILLFSLIACGSSDDKEPQSEDVTIKCSPEKIEAVAQASQYVVNVVCSGKEWTAFASDDCSSWVKVNVMGSSSSQAQRQL